MQAYSEPLFTFDDSHSTSDGNVASVDKVQSTEASPPAWLTETISTRSAKAPREKVEVEAKFVGGQDAKLPSLGHIAPVGPTMVSELNALYFDTPDLDLSQRGITLRRRSGGKDAGWHVKVKTSDATQKRELHAPITGARPPTILREALPLDLREAPLIPVARMLTTRKETPLLALNGHHLATVCEDQVLVHLAPRGENSPGFIPPTVRNGDSWREVEVELARGDWRVLAHLDHVLQEAGFRPAPYASKVGRALQSWPKPSGRHGLANEHVWSYALTQIGVLQAWEQLLLAGDTEAVRRSRAAARRLRSTLTSFKALFCPELSDHLARELKWFESVLSPIREVQVLRSRLSANTPATVTELIDSRIRSATSKVRTELRSPRFELLHDSLADLCSPVSATEMSPPTEDYLWAELAPLVATVKDHLGSIGEISEDLATGPAATDSWHRVRKASKNVRYAYEALETSHSQIGSIWSGATSNLGLVQDAISSARVLRDMLATTKKADVELQSAIRSEIEAQLSTVTQDAGHALSSTWNALAASLGRYSGRGEK